MATKMTKTDEIEMLKSRVYNLTLFLNEVELHHPKVWRALMKKFEGLPGYCPAEVLPPFPTETEKKAAKKAPAKKVEKAPKKTVKK